VVPLMVTGVDEIMPDCHSREIIGLTSRHYSIRSNSMGYILILFGACMYRSSKSCSSNLWLPFFYNQMRLLSSWV